MLISALAFGGGQAAIPLVERVAVGEMGWVTPVEFASAVGLSYITPGPVLILATFVGYRAEGLAGALAATVGVFLLPTLLAALAARGLRGYLQHPLLSAFGRGAAAAVVGLLAATAVHLAGAFGFDWRLLGLATVAFVVVWRTRVPPMVVLLAGVAVGIALG
jgi:chromate transporter